MIVPVKKDDAFLADVQDARANTQCFHLWWLGQSGFLVQWHNHHLLIDPYLSDSLTKKYCSTDKRHVRMTQRIVDPRRLDFIDVVTSSHNHTDHLDAETIMPLMAVNPSLAIIVAAANRQFAADRLNVCSDRLTVVDDGTMASAAGFTFHGVPAAHESVERDDQGRCKFLGVVIRFGDWTIYHSGDTVLYDGMIESLSCWSIDVALLPINGRLTERRVPGNLWGREAAQLARDVQARVVIPCHYDMFTFNTATPDEFVAKATQLGQRHIVLRCGQRLSSEELANR